MRKPSRTFAKTVLAYQDLMMSRALETFWSRVRKSEDGCWIWIGGSKNSFGHGRFNLFGVALTAHRVSWELAHGIIEDNLNVLHKCDNPPCVRPDHLFLGTQLENIRDMHQKGRARVVSGDSHPFSKMSAEMVKDARARYALGGISMRDLGKEYGVTHSAFWQALRGATWKDVGL